CLEGGEIAARVSLVPSGFCYLLVRLPAVLPDGVQHPGFLSGFSGQFLFVVSDWDLVPPSQTGALCAIRSADGFAAAATISDEPMERHTRLLTRELWRNSKESQQISVKKSPGAGVVVAPWPLAVHFYA